MADDRVLRGRRALVTGASRGFGKAVADSFARAGADLVLCSRSEAELSDAKAELVSSFPERRIEIVVADVSNERSVGVLAERVGDAFGDLDILVCNAGIYGPKGASESVDWAAWTNAFEVNVFGVALCVRAFAPMIKRSERGKVIVLSGGGATKPMPFLSAYAATKAAVVRFGETLAEEWRPDGVDVNMVAPGALNTRLLDEILEAGPDAVGRAFYEASLKQKSTGGTPLARGAELCVFLASRASDGVTGKLISAVWDPWGRFPELRESLDSSDVYTLRRIVPSERGFTW